MPVTETGTRTALDETLTLQNLGAMTAVPNISEQPISEKALESGTGAESHSYEAGSGNPVTAKEPASDDLASYTFSKKQIAYTMAGIGMLFFIAALDATIMASIYVPVASDFGALGQAVWIITTYMLSSTVVQAIIGKISDVLGRVETTLTSTAIFLIGSVLCGASQSMNMLIASRTIQGIGGGGILGLSVVLMGDIFSERERGKYIGVIAGTLGIATVVGPVMGGGIIEHASWRIVFWINIPICIISMALIYFTLKLPKTKGTFKEKIKRIDFIGCVLFTIGMVPILLGLSWGGQQYEWTSAQVLACLICGFVMLLVFGYVEYRFVANPIIPIRLLGNHNVFSGLVASLATGAILYGIANIIPTWELAVKHASTISGGLHLIPSAVGYAVGAPLTGVYMAKLGRYLAPLRVGAVLAAAGASLLLLYKTSTGMAERIIYLFLAGLGLGFISQPSLLVCQASVGGKHMATVSASHAFLRTLGGILATSIMTSILDSHIKSGITGLVYEFPTYASDITSTLVDQRNIYSNTIPHDIQSRIIHLWADSMHSAFFVFAAISGITIISCFAITHVALGEERKKTIE